MSELQHVHLLAEAADVMTLCGLRLSSKAALPLMLGRYAQAAVDAGREVCPACAEAWPYSLVT